MRPITEITKGKVRITPDIRYPGDGWIGFVPPVTGDAFDFAEKQGYYWLEIYQPTGVTGNGTRDYVENTFSGDFYCDIEDAGEYSRAILSSSIEDLRIGMAVTNNLLLLGDSYITKTGNIGGNDYFDFAPKSPDMEGSSQLITVFNSGKNLFHENNLVSTELWFFPTGNYAIQNTTWGYNSEVWNESSGAFKTISRRPYDPNNTNYSGIMASGCRIRVQNDINNKGFVLNPRLPIGIKIFECESFVDYSGCSMDGTVQNYNNLSQSFDEVTDVAHGFSGKILGYSFESRTTNNYKMYCSGYLFHDGLRDYSSWINCTVGIFDSVHYVNGEFYINADGLGSFESTPGFIRNNTGINSPTNCFVLNDFNRPPKIVWNNNGIWRCEKAGDPIASGRISRNPYINIVVSEFYTSDSGIEIFKATGDSSNDYELFATFASSTRKVSNGNYDFYTHENEINSNTGEYIGFLTEEDVHFNSDISSLTGIEKQLIYRDYDFQPGIPTFFKTRAYKTLGESTVIYSPFAFHENSTYPKVKPTGYCYPSALVVDSDNPDNRFYAVCQFSNNSPVEGVSSYVILPDWKYSAKIVKRCQDVVMFTVGTGVGPTGEITSDTKSGRYQADGWSFLRFYHAENHNFAEAEAFTAIRFMSGNAQNPTEILASDPELISTIEDSNGLVNDAEDLFSEEN